MSEEVKNSNNENKFGWYVVIGTIILLLIIVYFLFLKISAFQI